MADFTINDIEFLEPEGNFGPPKATVHKSGKLGFSQGAATLVNFELNKFFKIGRKKDENDVLFLIPTADETDPLTFKVYKTGGYYYLKTRKLLNQLDIDYRNEQETVSFDIDEVSREGHKFYKMIRRKRKHKELNQ